MNDIVTNDFVYEVYDSKNSDHLDLIKELEKDLLTNEFFSDFKSIVDNTDNNTFYSYIVLNKYGLIGLITLTKIEDNSFVMSHIINPSFRGLKYSSKIKRDFVDYMINNDIADKIICYIDRENKRSISSMMKTNPSDITMDKDKKMLIVTYKKSYTNKQVPNK